MPKQCRSVAIVGIGLIGGSIGLGLLRNKLADEVVGIGRRQANLDEAKRLGAVTRATLNLVEGVAGADLIVVCTPVNEIAPLVRQTAAACPAGAIITDVGSTKAQVVSRVRQAASEESKWQSGVQFLGSHPLAGNEKKGASYAEADLLAGRVVVVTPTSDNTPEAVETLTSFWSSLKARVIRMSAEEHDRAVASTSHLPHMLAAALASATPRQFAELTATGWLDTTRIAAGDPNLWQQILLTNRDHVLAALDRFAETLADYRAALVAGKPADLEELLTKAKQTRDALGS